MKKSISILLAISLFCASSVPLSAKTINQLEQEKKQLENKAKDLENKKQELQNKANDTQSILNDTENKKDAVFNEISVLDNNILETENEIERLNNELNETNQRLQKAEADLSQAELDREKQYQTLKSRIKYMYENGGIGYLDVLLNFKSFSELLNRVEYINDIITYDNQVFNEMKEIEELIKVKVKEVATEKQTLEILSKDQDDKKHALEETKSQKQQVLEKLSSDAEEYKRQLAETEKDSNEIENLINSTREEAARIAKEAAQKREEQRRAAEAAAKAEAARKAAAAKSSSSNSSSSSSAANTPAAASYEYTGGKLLWPLPGYDSPNGDYGFGGRTNPINGRWEVHRGMDIPAPRGTTVRAAAGGVVITAKYLNSYGNAVIIDHGNGLSTVYAHNSKLLVSAGDVVSSGQAISQVGSTGDSTGNHLHFEVRINGQYTNPIPYVK